MNVPETVAALGSRVGRGSALTRILRPAYGRALEKVYGRRGLPWSINGETFRIIPRLRHMLPPVNEAALFHFLSAEIQQGDVVFDIGSFLGTYAMLAARRTGECGRVMAFEPSTSSFRALERHFAMNGLHAPRAVARCAAVGARPEERRLLTFDDEPYRNMIAPACPERAPASREACPERAFASREACPERAPASREACPERAPASREACPERAFASREACPERAFASRGANIVKVVTVDGIAEEIGRPPDWIRMDVQGLEFDVLAGAASVLRESRGRLRIVAEMHPDQWPDYGVQPSEAVQRLAAFGLRARSLEPAGDPFTQSGHAILEPLR